MQELFQELSKEREEGQRRLEEFPENFNRQDTRSLERPRMQRLPKVVWRGPMMTRGELCLPGDTDPAWRTIGEDAPVEGDQKMARPSNGPGSVSG